MGFASFDPYHALSFLALALPFIWFAPDMTRKELTDITGEKGRLDDMEAEVYVEADKVR
jgi:hypothetical protein